MGIITEVSAELATSLAKLAGDKPMASDKAQDEFLELVIYGNKVPAVAKFLHQFFNSGAAVIHCALDPLWTESAMKKVFCYHLDKRVERVLAACRTGDFVSWNGQGVECHKSSIEMANYPSAK